MDLKHDHVAIQLPFELWTRIASYLPSAYFPRLCGVNRALYEFGMDVVYRRLNIGLAKPHKRIARRVRRIDLALDVVSFKVTESYFKQKRKVIVIMERLLLKRSKDPHRSRASTKGAISILLKALHEMFNVKELHIFYHDDTSSLGLGELGISILRDLWKVVSLRVQSLALYAPIGITSTLLADAFKMPSAVRDLKLVVSDWTSVEPKAIAAVAAFTNIVSSASKVTSLRLCLFPVPGLMESLDCIPDLRILEVPSSHISITPFLNKHGPTLQELFLSPLLHLAPSPNFMSSLDLPNLHSLHISLPYAFFGCTPWDAGNLKFRRLVRLKVSFGGPVTFKRDILPIFQAFERSGLGDRLRELQIEVPYVASLLFDHLSRTFPSLHALSAVSMLYNPVHSCPSIQDPAILAQCSYPEWNLVDLTIVIAGVREERAHLQALGDLIAQGELKGVVDSVFTIEDVVKGYERLMTSRATGKVIVTVNTALNLRFQKELTIKEFAANVLSLDLPDPSEIRKTADNSLEHRRKAYCQFVPHETNRYNPFVAYVNDVFDRKKPNASMILCRNDPTLWWGINGDRKPDGHGVTPNTLKAEGRGSVDNLSNEGPKKSPFHPCEVLTFWEFKLFEKDLMAVFNKSLEVEVEAEQAESTNHTTQNQETPNSESSTSVAGKKRAAAPHADDRAAKSPRPSSSPEITPAPRRVADPDVTETPEMQCASYALEMLSYGLRQHVISFLISDSEIQFLYYDRSILLRSEPLNFICRWYMFEYIMEHIATFTLEQWGIRTDVMPGVAPETLRQNGLVKPQRYSKGTYHGLFKKVKVPLPNYGTLELGRIIHQTHGLRGRGTLVVNARVLDKNNAEVVAKFSWPAKSRQSEAEILRHVYSKVEAAWKDEEWDPKDHLPNLLHDAEFPDPTGIQGRLFAHFSEQNSEDNPYEERILRVHVFERLYPIDEFIEKPAAFIGRRYFEFVRCLVCVHDIADVLHCDVSRRNFMIRKKGDKLYGVLNDFDLAIMTAQANKGPSSKQRTGTRPFMAIELLEKSPPPPHIHRHDLESCFYLLLDLSSGHTVTSWATKSMEDLANAKHRALSRAPVLLPRFTEMTDYLRHARVFFNPYLDFLNDTVVDTYKETDTFDGRITGAGFLHIANTYLPCESLAVLPLCSLIDASESDN
ncbi:hypothetical protein ONZ45_g13280 [Pleurotus djamor]|nr:hypothetical protein ONZ45_g13280 [Pleurotus djamor]